MRDRAERIVNLVRLGAGLLFLPVLLVNGPVLGVDPPALTARLLGLSVMIAGTAALLLWRPSPSVWASAAAIAVDVFAIATAGALSGGIQTHMSSLLLVIIALAGLRLDGRAVVFSALACTLGYVGMVWAGPSAESLDRHIVYLSIAWIMGTVGMGTVNMSRFLATRAIERHRERIALEQTLGRFFSPQVAELLLRGDGRLERVEREVSVVFADLVGFTELGENTDGGALFEIVETYLGALADVALATEGTVDNYLGDALLIVFNAPLEQPDHAARAVECAREMREAMARLRRRRLREGQPVLRLRISVNTGPAAAGPIGTDLRRQYTVIGDAVNVAARLNELAEPGEIVIGAQAAALAGLDLGAPEQRILRGRRQPVQLHHLPG